MLGEALAVGCAMSWAVAVILFKRCDDVAATPLNLFKNVLSSVLLLATLLLVGGRIDLDRSTTDWALLIVSGVIGIAIADTLYLESLKRVGASVVAIMECAYTPTIIALSVLFLGEAPTWVFAAGATLVVGGVFIAARSPGNVGTSGDPAHFRRGVTLGISAIVLMAGGIVLAKPALNRGDLVEVTLVRLLAGVAGQLIWITLRPNTLQVLRILRPNPSWRTMVPAAFLGTYVAMLLWLGGMKYTSMSTASTLNQLTTVFTLVLAWLVLGERLTPRRLIGGFASVGGALLILTYA